MQAREILRLLAGEGVERREKAAEKQVGSV